jgi:hypothetical protein
VSFLFFNFHDSGQGKQFFVDRMKAAGGLAVRLIRSGEMKGRKKALSCSPFVGVDV